jgi:hypothetical protein
MYSPETGCSLRRRLQLLKTLVEPQKWVAWWKIATFARVAGRQQKWDRGCGQPQVRLAHQAARSLVSHSTLDASNLSKSPLTERQIHSWEMPHH